MIRHQIPLDHGESILFCATTEEFWSHVRLGLGDGYAAAQAQRAHVMEQMACSLHEMAPAGRA